MASSALRPLSVGEILDAGVKVVTRNWKPLLGSLLLVSTPVWALFILLAASIDSTAFQFGADGSLNRYVNVYLNDEDVRVLDGLDTSVGESDTLVILPAMAGGCA